MIRLYYGHVKKSLNFVDIPYHKAFLNHTYSYPNQKECEPILKMSANPNTKKSNELSRGQVFGTW